MDEKNLSMWKSSPDQQLHDTNSVLNQFLKCINAEYYFRDRITMYMKIPTDIWQDSFIQRICSSLPSIPPYILLKCYTDGRTEKMYQKEFQIGKLVNAVEPRSSKILSIEDISVLPYHLKSIPSDVSLPILPHGKNFGILLQDPGKYTTLNTYILIHEDMTIEKSLFIAIELVSIYKSIHEKGITLRNIDPKNIAISDSNDGNFSLFAINFSLANLLAFEYANLLLTQEFTTYDLQFFSPELFGQNGFPIDSRSDIYSIGNVLYNLFCKNVPFPDAKTVCELHQRQEGQYPKEPHVANILLPLEISKVIMKCIQKDPDERYRTTKGLYDDLVYIQTHLQNLEHFEVGKTDIAVRLKLSSKTFGRKEELAKLTEEFNSVRNGTETCAAMFISGSLGVGKSSLLREFKRSLGSQQHIFFITGKCERSKQRDPFSPIIDAVRQLLARIHADPKERQSVWREKISNSMGENIALLLEVVPELGGLFNNGTTMLSSGQVRHSNATSVFSMYENRFRFNFAVATFFSLFCNSQTQLVLVLEDLQWASPDTLQMVQYLLSFSSFFFFIGTHRVEEAKLKNIIANCSEICRVSTISLSGLSKADIESIIVSSIRFDNETASKLAEWVFAKSCGCPFTSKLLLHTLYSDEIIFFDPLKKQWKWNQDESILNQIPLSNTKLIQHHLSKLPSEVQDLLIKAALIGTRFSLAILSKVVGRPEDEIYIQLVSTLNLNLIIEVCNSVDVSPDLLFSNDLVRDATAAMVDEETEKELKLHIAKALTQLDDEQVDANIYEIAKLYVASKELLTTEQEKLDVIPYFRYAIKKAKDATAYDAAFTLAKDAIAFLDEKAALDKPWPNFELAFKLYYDLLECGYLSGQYDQIQPYFPIIIAKAPSIADRHKLIFLQASHYELSGGTESSFKLLSYELNSLHEKRFTLPSDEEECKKGILTECQLLKENVSKKSISDLKIRDSSEVGDLVHVIFLVFRCAQASYTVSIDIYVYLILKLVNFTFEYGIMEPCVFGMTAFSVAVRTLGFEYLPIAKELAQVGLAAAETFKNKLLLSYCLNHVGSSSIYYFDDIMACLPYLKKSFNYSIESGNFKGASYAGSNITIYAYSASTQPLDKLKVETQRYLEYFKRVKDSHFFDLTEAYIHVYTVLEGSGNSYHGERYKQKYANSPFFLTAYYFAEISKAAMYHRVEWLEDGFVEHGLALCKQKVKSLFYEHMFHFFCGLAFCQLCKKDRERYLPQAEQLVKHFFALSKASKANFELMHCFLAAEVEKAKGNFLESLELFNRAIEMATVTHKLLYKGLLNESVAHLWRESPHQNSSTERYIAAHLEEAFNAYNQVHAKDKLSLLLQNYKMYLPKEVVEAYNNPYSPSSSKQFNVIDIYSTVKEVQSISSIIDIEKFLHDMMLLLYQNSGGSKVIFIDYTQGSGLTVRAIASSATKATIFAPPTPLDSYKDIPHTVIQYSLRKQHAILISHAFNDEQFSKDPYFVEKNIKSAACIPLIRNQLKGILYVENNNSFHFFTSEKVEVLKILCNQLIISVENAQHIQMMIEATKQISEEKANMEKAQEYRNRLEFFIDSTLHELRSPCVGIRANAEFVLENIEKLRTLGFSQEIQAETIEFVQTILRCVLHKRLVIDDALDLSRLLDSSLNLVSVPFKPSELITSVIQMLKPLIDKAKLFIQVVLPATPQDFVINGDPGRIRQIVLNLLSNAIKFTKKGGITVTLQYNTAQENQATMQVAVKDTGIGMSESEMEKIFHRFYSGEYSVSKEFSGTGLGLVICKKLLELMNGTIQVHSKKNHGSTFSFKIPCTITTEQTMEQEYIYSISREKSIVDDMASTVAMKTEAIASPAVTPTTSQPNTPLSPKNQVILVVDDNVVNQKIVVKFLESEGYRCKVASNGKEALDLVMKESFLCVFMDIVMPVMDGLEATKSIRSTGMNIPIIGLSGNARKEQVDIAYVAGMNSYITKPFDKKQLVKAIADFTQKG